MVNVPIVFAECVSSIPLMNFFSPLYYVSSEMLFICDTCSLFMYFHLAHSVETYVATFRSHSLQKISYWMFCAPIKPLTPPTSFGLLAHDPMWKWLRLWKRKQPTLSSPIRASSETLQFVNSRSLVMFHVWWVPCQSFNHSVDYLCLSWTSIQWMTPQKKHSRVHFSLLPSSSVPSFPSQQPLSSATRSGRSLNPIIHQLSQAKLGSLSFYLAIWSGFVANLECMLTCLRGLWTSFMNLNTMTQNSYPSKSKSEYSCI